MGLLIYDGPNELFPRISKMMAEFAQLDYFIAFTFQIFVKMAYLEQRNIIMMYYDHIYVAHNIKASDSLVSINFHNDTLCGKLFTHAQACVDDISSKPGTYVSISIGRLNINGEYSGSHLGAGLVVFNSVEEKKLKLTEFYVSIPPAISVRVNITSNGNSMIVDIYAYSLLATISVDAMITSGLCKGIFAEDNLLSPPSLPVARRRVSTTDINITTILKDNSCIEMHFMDTKRNMVHLQSMKYNITCGPFY